MSAHDFPGRTGHRRAATKALKSLGEAFLAGVERASKSRQLGLPEPAVRRAAPPGRAGRGSWRAKQADRTVNLDGPPVQAAFDKDGNRPRPPGLRQKCGVELSQIDQSGAKLKFSQSIAGVSTVSLLPGIVEASLNELPIPKRMRWAARRKSSSARPSGW